MVVGKTDRMKDCQHTDIEGTNFSLLPIIPFETWLQENYKKANEFYKFTKQDKEKIFLRWKWGFMDERANENLEAGEQATIYLFKDAELNQLSETWKFYIEQKLLFNKICIETKKRIGLIEGYNPYYFCKRSSTNGGRE